jgi:hypothetical protein
LKLVVRSSPVQGMCDYKTRITSGFRRYSHLFLLVGLCEGLFSANCQVTRDSVRHEVLKAKADSRTAATQTLTRLQRLLTPGAWQWLNVSPDEIHQAELSEPIVVFRIKMDDLKRISPSTDAYALLGAPLRVLYPITIRNQPRASLSISKNAGAWEFDSLGGFHLTRLLSEHLRAIESRTDLVYAVQIPSLDLYFLGEGLGNSWNLVAIQDDTRISMKDGDIASALPALRSIVMILGLQ